jgi:hypothetical protein
MERKVEVVSIWRLKDRQKHQNLSLEPRRLISLTYHAIDLDRTLKILQSK